MEVAAVAGPIVKLLPKLLSVMDKKMKQLDSLEVDAGFIRRDLQSIQDIIGRSSGGSISDLWIRDLRSLADDMEDCIDSFQVGKTTRISFVAKIAKLKKRSKDTLEQLQNSISIAGAAAPPAAADPQAGGTGDPEEELVALLGRSQSEEQEGKLKVISVAGFGGLGMTRLAHKVYSDRDVRSQFPLRAWVRAPPGMSVHKLLQEIHDQLMPILHTKKQVEHRASPSSSRSKPQVNGDAEHGASASSSKSIPQVNRDVEHGQSASHVHRLAEILKTGRYLIVIDDVNTHELYDVLSAFSWADGVDGRIIMTTAIQLPAATCCRCGDGSPLAMDSTSQVFIGELTESGFVETCLHLRDDTLARMQRRNNEILSSPVVQDLLLYFCMFPRDHPVRRNPLIRRWLAEGLVFPQPETESISQDVAAKNLESLISRNVIQPIQVRNYGNVKKCQTSGMMLNSISSKSKSQNFITMLCGSQTAKNPLGNVRRLSLHLNDAENGPLNLPKDLSRLHTLAVFPNDANVARHQANLNYANYKLLRVLDLKECADVKAEHVGKICDLLLLKYLSFGDSIDKLPRKIAKLKWLEALDMRRTRVVALPIEVLQLPELKHLLGKFQLREGDHTPKKLEKLLTKESSSELQKLSGFVTSKSEGFAQLMSRMGNLRKVKIWCDSTADVTKLADLVEAMKKFIREGLDMTRVDRSLSIDIQGCPAECSELFMDSLQATGRLTSLKLRGNLTRLPRFQAKLNYIEELCLSRTNLSGDTILSCLSALRMTLKYLKLVEDKLEHLVIEPEHFRSLKGICLVGEQSLEDITIQARAMPYLVSLHVICEALGDLPGIEITSMSGLKEVALHSAVRDSIKDGWQAAAVNHPNRPNVLFIHPADSWHRDPPPCGTKGKTASETKPIATRIASSIKGGIFSFTQRAS